MSTKSKYFAGILGFFDGITQETVQRLAPVAFVEDFLGAAVDVVNKWTLLDTAGGAETVLANAPNGVLSCALDATSEAQLAGISAGDTRNLVLNQGLVFESRFRLSVLPTGAVIAVVGVAGNHNAAVDTVAESAWFRLDGNGAITVECDDTANETTKVSTGVTVIANQYVVARIDFTDPTDVKFYLDGARVASGTTFNMNTVPTLALQPYARISKGVATSVGTLQLDKIAFWQKRS